MKYKVSPKNQIVRKNTNIQADGFSSWILKNIGTTTIVLDDVIEIRPGDKYGYDLYPYVQYDNSISIAFVGAGENKGLLIQEYNKEI